ncbi:MAG: hypothetical protein JO259_17700 [Mycobacterium sp.]|nr:hypothetical protein [Mycobacterium sp.]
MSFRPSSLGVLMSAIGVVGIGLSASTGANKAVADPVGDRLGCNTYCQNAGGYGGAGTPKRYAVTIASKGTVTADSDGYVPVTLRCNLSVQCSGAVIVELNVYAGDKDAVGEPIQTSVGDGRSDLLVDAGATRTIAVPLPAPVIAYLRSHGPTTLTQRAITRGEEGPRECFRGAADGGSPGMT